MKSFEVFYRVPAGRCKNGQEYGTYLSSTRVEGETREEAVKALIKRHPEYTEVH